MSHNPSSRAKPSMTIVRMCNCRRFTGLERGISFGPVRWLLRFGDRLGEELAQLVDLDLAMQERPADPAGEHETDSAAGDLLVLAHMLDQPVGVPDALRKSLESSRQPGHGEVPADAIGILERAEPELDGEVEGQAHAHGHRLAMQDLVAIAALGLE